MVRAKLVVWVCQENQVPCCCLEVMVVMMVVVEVGLVLREVGLQEEGWALQEAGRGPVADKVERPSQRGMEVGVGQRAGSTRSPWSIHHTKWHHSTHSLLLCNCKPHSDKLVHSRFLLSAIMRVRFYACCRL